MPYWEYKVITSGKGGFATPALLEKFLNDLGRDEWEIVHYQTPPDNLLAFTGLARRSTQRDWTLEDAAAAAAKVEAEKLRAEFEAKFKAASSPAPEAAEERSPSFLEEKTAPDDGLRKLVDTSRDDDPEAADDDKADEWDKLTAAEEDELPTFFEAIRPHMRRNQRGPGMSVGVEYLGKKWDLSEDDVKGALAECGFVMPVDEDSPVEYLEYDGDLYWLNINRRGELWINTKEKPRPVFRPVKGARIEPEPPKADTTSPATESGAAPAAEGSAPADGAEPKVEGAATNEDNKAPAPALPTGTDLLAKIRPHMRRNRRGPGGSGSLNFLSRALRTKEAELKAAFLSLGLTPPASPNDKPVYTEFANELWWLNLDSRGGLWINGREKKDGEAAPAETAATPGTEAAVAPAAAADAAAAPAPATPEATAPAEVPAPAPEAAPDATSAIPPLLSAPVASEPAPVPPADTPAPAPATTAPAADAPLAAARQLLKETRTGSLAGKVERLAADLGRTAEDLLAALVAAGLKVPEKPREKPVFIEHAGEILWLNRNARGELWLNAKVAKIADAEAAAAESDDPEDGEDAAGEDEEKKGARRGARTRPKKAE